MGLDELRDEIRKKDLEIVKLISERTEIAKQIGMTKIEQGTPIRNVGVENKVISRYVDEGSRYGLSKDCMTSVAKAAIQEAVEAQSKLVKREHGKKVAVIGGAGKMGRWMANLLEGIGHDITIIDPAIENGHGL